MNTFATKINNNQKRKKVMNKKDLERLKKDYPKEKIATMIAEGLENVNVALKIAEKLGYDLDAPQASFERIEALSMLFQNEISYLFEAEDEEDDYSLLLMNADGISKFVSLSKTYPSIYK